VFSDLFLSTKCILLVGLFQEKRKEGKKNKGKNKSRFSVPAGVNGGLT